MNCGIPTRGIESFGPPALPWPHGSRIPTRGIESPKERGSMEHLEESQQGELKVKTSAASPRSTPHESQQGELKVMASLTRSSLNSSFESQQGELKAGRSHRNAPVLVARIPTRGIERKNTRWARAVRLMNPNKGN